MSNTKMAYAMVYLEDNLVAEYEINSSQSSRELIVDICQPNQIYRVVYYNVDWDIIKVDLVETPKYLASTYTGSHTVIVTYPYDETKKEKIEIVPKTPSTLHFTDDTQYEVFNDLDPNKDYTVIHRDINDRELDSLKVKTNDLPIPEARVKTITDNSITWEVLNANKLTIRVYESDDLYGTVKEKVIIRSNLQDITVNRETQITSYTMVIANNPEWISEWTNNPVNLDLFTPLDIGSQGEMVVAVQSKLRTTITGIYDENTKTKIMEFQGSYGTDVYSDLPKNRALTVDGKAGPMTLHALFTEHPPVNLTENDVYEMNLVTQANDLLVQLGFADHRNRVNKSESTISPLIYANVFLFQHLTNGLEVSGKIDQKLLLKLNESIANNIDYTYVNDRVVLKEKLGSLVINRDGQKNGFLSKSGLVMFPSTNGRIAWTKKNTAIAWAAMVCIAAFDDPNLDLYNFQGRSPDDVYRNFLTQAYYKYVKFPNGNIAATPGNSNHGWGDAIDMAFNINVYESDRYKATSLESIWVENNGTDFGFTGYYVEKNSNLYNADNTINKGCVKTSNISYAKKYSDDTYVYWESWHKNFNGL